MRIGVIRNPKSGRGAAEGAWDSMQDRLRRDRPAAEFIFELTDSPGSAAHQARAMAGIGCQIVIACGGDGTVSDVMQGLLGTDAALAILPLGTGNDFARTLGVAPKIERAFAAIREGLASPVDIGLWRQNGREGHFLNVAGSGFDAAVADRVNHGFRYLRGRTAYVAAVMAGLIRFKAPLLSICMDGEAVKCEAMLCAIANARSYGGGMLVAPTAEIDDGLLDVVLVEKLGRAQFLWAFPRVFRGTHLNHPRVRHWTAKSIAIDTDRPTPFLIDGELLPPGPVQIEVVPRALKVIFPPPAKNG